jgi:DNA-directed RNA polymerase subunit H (RpoH/RPB5)
MSQIKYPPLEVYKNLHHCLRHRNLELVSGSYIHQVSNRSKRAKAPEVTLPEVFEESVAIEPSVVDVITPAVDDSVEAEVDQKPSKPHIGSWLPDKDFVDLIQWERYCVIEARDLATKDRRYPKVHKSCTSLKTKTFIIILDYGYDVNSADLTKILGKLPDVKSKTRKFNMDVLIISENYLTVHAAKKLAQYEFLGSEAAGYINLINELFTLFMYDIFERTSSAAHRILSAAEEESVFKSLRVAKYTIQKIAPTDPKCVVLGAVTGDVLEIVTFNENTAVDLHYRVVRI